MTMPLVARASLCVLALFAAAAPAHAQKLSAEKYTLDNGMTVILHVDHTLPVATINLWYRVGARNEPAGRSGFAHLFEHLMFMGTKRAPGNAFDTMMESAGGSNNASTSLDRTNYFSEGPSSLLPTLLWLDADRLEALGTNMTDDKLGKQRDIVRNEIRQNVENSPYGRAYNAMPTFVFPPGHPYHNNVYGTHADLEAATLNDVRDFFATFYCPANCSLVVAGDFDPGVIKPQVAKLFGTLPAGNAPKPRDVEPAKLDRVIRTTMLDKVELPKLLITYLAPGLYQPGDAEVALTARVLGEGHNSRLYKRLVQDDQTCADVSVWQESASLQSLLVIDVSAKPDADLAKIEAAVDDEIAKFRDHGPTRAELTQRTASVERDMLDGLQSIQARADKLNEYQFYFGDPDSLQKDLDRYRHATTDGVRKVARDTLTQDARLIMTVLPEDAATASPRDQVPTTAPATQPVAFEVPTPEIFTLASGTKVELFHRPELPLISATLLAKPTTRPTVDAPEQAGRSTLAAQMMGEGTGEMDGPAFAAAMQALGGSFDSEAHRTGLTTSLTVLERNFGAAAKLWLDATFRPRMHADDFDRVKQLTIADLAQRQQVPGAVAGNVAQALLWGVGSEQGVPEDGDPQTVGTLTLDDANAARAELLADPASLTIFVAGNLTREQAKGLLEPLLTRAVATTRPTSRAVTQTLQPTDDSPSTSARPAFAPSNGKLRVAIVDRPDAPQTAVRLVAPGIAYTDPRRIPLTLMNVALGGSFGSRLNMNLREQHGYTYGAGSRFRVERRAGWFAASADVKSDVTGAAIKELLGELHRAAGGDLSADELVKSRETFAADTVQRFATIQSELGTAAALDEVGAGVDAIRTDLQAASGATLDQLNDVARQLPKLDDAVLVLVGDEKLIREQIKDLGLPAAISVDVNGKPVK